jgi:hypothetical protein
MDTSDISIFMPIVLDQQIHAWESQRSQPNVEQNVGVKQTTLPKSETFDGMEYSKINTYLLLI